MRVPCEVFYSTGFNGFDIPDAPALLYTAATRIETIQNGVFTRQDLYKAIVKLPLDWSNASGADYVKINDKYYRVQAINMTSERTAVLSLAFDPLTTYGGPAAQGWSGWVTRAHAVDDTLFANNAVEPFTQIDDWVEENTHTRIGPTAGVMRHIVGSTIALTETTGITNTKDSTTYSNGTDSVTIPATKRVPSSTKFSLAAAITDYGLIYDDPNICFYDSSEQDVQEAVALARDIGAESSILYSYQIESGYIAPVMYESGHRFNTIRGVLGTVDSGAPFAWLNGIKNNKVFSGQFSKYVLACPSSGCCEEYKADEINDGGTSPAFYFFSDPGPEGRPYFRPRRYKGNSTNYFQRAVTGSTWRNSPIAYAQYTGQAIDAANFAISSNAQRWRNAQAEAKRDETLELQTEVGAIRTAGRIAGMAAAGAAIPLVGPGIAIAGAAKEAASFGLSYMEAQGQNDIEKNNAQQLYEIENRQRRQELNLKASAKAVEVSFPQTASLQAYGGNIAFVYHVHISARDAQRLDNFFSAFGYATSEAVNLAHMTGRANHNYVEGDLKCITASMPLDARIIAGEMASHGIRIWHTKPSESALYNNPIAP